MPPTAATKPRHAGEQHAECDARANTEGNDPEAPQRHFDAGLCQHDAHRQPLFALLFALIDLVQAVLQLLAARFLGVLSYYHLVTYNQLLSYLNLVIYKYIKQYCVQIK